MYDKLRAYVEDLFSYAPKTKKANELREEFLANLSEKYRDLVAAGKSEDEAYHLVISGIGDIDELIKSLEETRVFDPVQKEKDTKKNALIVSVSVMLYFIALIVLILGSESGMDPVFALCLMLLISAFATGLLIYQNLSRPKYQRTDDTLVEEFKEFSAQSDRRVKLTRAISSCIWTITVPLYLIISFTFHNWHISWIIFLIAVAAENIVKSVIMMRDQS